MEDYKSQGICCPQCGNSELQVTNEINTETKGKNYSSGKGCLGYLRKRWTITHLELICEIKLK